MPEDAWERIEQSEPLRVKFGIDPTRDRLHLGHFVPLRLCRKLQEQGHQLDLVLGTLTARLGDPSGQDRTRPILREDEVDTNAERLLAQCRQVLLPGFRVHRNHRFAEALTVPTFLTRLAARVTVASMLARDGFRRRAESKQPIALHELLVPLLQGWDSVELQAEVEIGGTDQLFNFQVARRLQEAEGQTPEVALMTPVIDGTDGRKMSKSFGNTVWLDEVPAQMFGQVMSISDETCRQWWPLLSDLDWELSEHPMERKKRLAWDLVCQLHGSEAADRARASFEQTVQRRELPDDIPEIDGGELVVVVAAARGESRTRARRLIFDGAVRVDGNRVVDLQTRPPEGAVIQIGKRLVVRIRRQSAPGESP